MSLRLEENAEIEAEAYTDLQQPVTAEPSLKTKLERRRRIEDILEAKRLREELSEYY